jgi:hypothetical protein
MPKSPSTKNENESKASPNAEDLQTLLLQPIVDQSPVNADNKSYSQMDIIDNRIQGKSSGVRV